MELRAYLPEDAAATLAVFRRAIRVTAAGDYTPAQIEAWASDDIDGGDWAARRLASATVVAVAEGRVVGFSDVDDSGCIDMLFVDPAVARRGVASRLLESLGDGPRSVHASRTARPFFERHGFVVVAEGRPITRGVELVNYVMERPAVGNSGSVPGDGPSPADPDDDSPHRT
ncbi:putative acetyltransferase [Frondihabitans sp. PhB188]|nr:putative acetyltransferase [Frondihabitans sp. PhB188]